MKKVVLITGVSSGIGKETARLLIQKGYTVYGVARRIEKMEELKADGIHLLQMDVTLDDSMTAGINEIISKEGRIDALINNAGYGSFGAVEDVPLSEARRQMEVNVFGMARLIQLTLPYMRKERSGKIINISSIAGKIGQPHGAWYHASKFAVEGFSDCLRMELNQFGIDVVLVEPGPIITEWNRIAREHLLAVSGDTVYQGMAKRHFKMMERADRLGSQPLVIARVIVRAMDAKRPRTRYAAGGGAKMILFLHRLLSDRMFDRIMRMTMK